MANGIFETIQKGGHNGVRPYDEIIVNDDVISRRQTVVGLRNLLNALLHTYPDTADLSIVPSDRCDTALAVTAASGRKDERAVFLSIE